MYIVARCHVGALQTSDLLKPSSATKLSPAADWTLPCVRQIEECLAGGMKAGLSNTKKDHARRLTAYTAYIDEVTVKWPSLPVNPISLKPPCELEAGVSSKIQKAAVNKSAQPEGDAATDADSNDGSSSDDGDSGDKAGSGNDAGGARGANC